MIAKAALLSGVSPNINDTNDISECKRGLNYFQVFFTLLLDVIQKLKKDGFVLEMIKRTFPNPCKHRLINRSKYVSERAKPENRRNDVKVQEIAKLNGTRNFYLKRRSRRTKCRGNRD